MDIVVQWKLNVFFLKIIFKTNLIRVYTKCFYCGYFKYIRDLFLEGFRESKCLSVVPIWREWREKVFGNCCVVQYVPAVVVYIYKERNKKKIKLHRQTKKTKNKISWKFYFISRVSIQNIILDIFWLLSSILDEYSTRVYGNRKNVSRGHGFRVFNRNNNRL